MRSSKSTLSRFADRFRFPDLRPAGARSRDDAAVRDALIAGLREQAAYEKNCREKMGGGAAGARGLGH
jgi:hypothetical protein